MSSLQKDTRGLYACRNAYLGTDRTTRYCANFVAAMPTLVWRRRSESGAGAAGGDNARNTAAAVPDEVVSAAAAAVPDKAVPAVSIVPNPPVHVAFQPRLASPAPAPVSALVPVPELVTMMGYLPPLAPVPPIPHGLLLSGMSTNVRSPPPPAMIAAHRQAVVAQQAVQMGPRGAPVVLAPDGTAHAASASPSGAGTSNGSGVGTAAFASVGGSSAKKRDLPRGVYMLHSGKCVSQLQWGGKLRYVGCFDTPAQASAAYVSVKKDLADVNLSTLSADDIDAAFDSANKKAMESVGGFIPRKKRKSERDLPRGVYMLDSGKYVSQIQWGGKLRYVGCFDTPAQASAACMSVKKDLADANLSTLSADQVNTAFDAAKKKALESVGGFAARELPRGVYRAKTGKTLFEANITVGWDGKNRYIGLFDTPGQASAAYMSVKKDLADANLSAAGADEVNAAFDAAKRKALEAGGILLKKRSRHR